jgi:hypothetical protein
LCGNRIRDPLANRTISIDCNSDNGHLHHPQSNVLCAMLMNITEKVANLLKGIADM